MKKYLVTGGAGFIGSHIVAALLKRGDFVRAVDNFSSGKKENIQEFLNNKRFQLVRGDVKNFQVAKKAVAGIDYVFHQAAVASVNSSIKDPLTSHDANVTGTLNLLLAAKEGNVKKLVYASSSSVYGNNPVSPKKENLPIDLVSPYALTKHAGEKYVQLFWQMYQFPTVCLRYFNVFGQKQDPFSEYAAVVPKFINAFLHNRQPIIYGTGNQTRDFIYVENVVQANLLAMDSKKANGEVFNVGSGKSITISHLFELLNKATGKTIKPLRQKARQGDVLHSIADISKAKKILKYEPIISFKDGLRETLEWYGKHQ